MVVGEPVPGQSAVAHFPVAGLVPTRQHCPGWVRILATAASEVLPGWITEGALSVGVVGRRPVTEGN